MATITVTVNVYLDNVFQRSKSQNFSSGQSSTYELWIQSVGVSTSGFLNRVHEYDAPGAGSYDHWSDYSVEVTAINRNTILDAYYISTRPSKFKCRIRSTLGSTRGEWFETDLIYSYGESLNLINVIHDTGWQGESGSFSSGTYNYTSSITFPSYTFTITKNSIFTFQFSSATVVAPSNVRVSPTTIDYGEGFTLSWDWNRSASTSDWFDIYYGTSTDYKYSTLINSVHPSSTTARTQSIFTSSWTHTGTCYFWVTYRSTAKHSATYATLIVQQLLQGKAYIYDNGTWKPAIPYIWNGSTWIEAEPSIYDGGTWK